MVRTYLAKKGMDLAAVTGALIDARFGGDQAKAAIDRLRALNPHVDLDRLGEDAVLLIPDMPAFKASAAATPQPVPVDAFRELLAAGLTEQVRLDREANAARAAERAEVVAAIRSAPFKRLAEGDPALAAQGEQALKAIATEEKSDKEASEILTDVGKAAIEALAQAANVLGVSR